MGLGRVVKIMVISSSMQPERGQNYELRCKPQRLSQWQGPSSDAVGEWA